jgi:drug/metabolite transporter (DMT)-like permease
LSAYIGELSALATALFFTGTSTMFTLAGRQVGSLVVNRTRLILAVIFLTIAHLILRTPLPIHAEAERWLWLGLSGIVGLVLGDAFLFQAFVLIGPRLSMLMMSLAPVIAAVLAWVLLHENLSALQIVGILITISGIAWVVLERNGQRRIDPAGNREYLMGLLFGFGGAAGQAIGLILAKKGLGGNFPALSGTLIRMLAAMTTLWIVTLLTRQAGPTFRQLNAHRRAITFIIGGAFTGPFLGVTFSLLAIQYTQVGVASTIMALPPVFLLPVGYFLFKERFGWQAIAGTAVAMLGVGLLFLV